jgi:SAM-dependent methyltransferase
MSDGRIDLRSVEPDGDAVACACGRRYPVVDGIPILIPHPEAFLRNELALVVESDLPSEVTAQLASGPADAPYPRLLEHLSTYLDAHWGDRAQPLVDFGGRAIAEQIAARSRHRVKLAVELGCSVGRIVAELAAGADHVVGIDSHIGALRRARHLLAGEPVAYQRRIAGRHYAAATATAGSLAVAGGATTLVCANALDPPLVPGMFDRVVALNLIDSVKSPRQLLAVVDGLCAPGGEIILSSPYAWDSTVMEDDERLGGADPAAEVVAIFREGRGLSTPYHIEQELQLDWRLRRDARCEATYCIHYLRVRHP